MGGQYALPTYKGQDFQTQSGLTLCRPTDQSPTIGNFERALRHHCSVDFQKQGIAEKISLQSKRAHFVILIEQKVPQWQLFEVSRHIDFMIDRRLRLRCCQLFLHGSSKWLTMNTKVDGEKTDYRLVKERALYRCFTDLEKLWFAFESRSMTLGMFCLYLQYLKSFFAIGCALTRRFQWCVLRRDSCCSAWEPSQGTPLEVRRTTLAVHKGLKRNQQVITCFLRYFLSRFFFFLVCVWQLNVLSARPTNRGPWSWINSCWHTKR